MPTIGKFKKCSCLRVLSLCLLVLSLCLHAQPVPGSKIQFLQGGIFLYTFFTRSVISDSNCPTETTPKTKFDVWKSWILTSWKVSFSCTNYLQNLWNMARDASHRKIWNLVRALGIIKSSFGRVSLSLKYYSQNVWYLAPNAQHQKIPKFACACSCSNCACYCSACAQSPKSCFWRVPFSFINSWQNQWYLTWNVQDQTFWNSGFWGT